MQRIICSHEHIILIEIRSISTLRSLLTFVIDFDDLIFLRNRRSFSIFHWREWFVCSLTVTVCLRNIFTMLLLLR